MYIRRTKTKTADHGEDSYTYRIVESVREGTQVKQRTLLNLGKNFAIEPAHWPLLAARIEQLLQGSAHLRDFYQQLLIISTSYNFQFISNGTTDFFLSIIVLH